MLYRIIAALLASVCISSADSLDVMQKKFIDQFLYTGGRNRVVVRSFAKFDELSKENAAFSAFINSPEIQQVCLNEPSSEQMQAAQLLLSKLYAMLLRQNITKITKRLKAIAETKRYWLLALHSQKESMFFKKYTLSSDNRLREKMERRVELLKVAEINSQKLLGASLYAQHVLYKVNAIDHLHEGLLLAIKPLSYILHRDEPFSLLDTLNYLGSIYSLIDAEEHKIADLLQKVRTPHHIDRYKKAYSAILLLGLVGVAMYPQHKESFVKYSEKSQKALQGFVQDFLIAPLKGLKRATWDRPDIKLEKFDMDDIPSTLWSCYSPERTLKYALQTPLKNLNQAIELSGEIVKRQQINYYLSAIMPILVGMYGAYRQGCYFYNHESYFKPMRLILRDIDIVCNKISGDEKSISFADYGLFYYLVLQMRDYVDCLQNNERIMMEYDIAELLAFDSSIGQKQRVLDRMYRTYTFLK